MIVKTNKVFMFEDTNFTELVQISNKVDGKKFRYLQKTLIDLAGNIIDEHEHIVVLEELNNKIIVYSLDYYSDGNIYTLKRSFEEGGATYVEIERTK